MAVEILECFNHMVWGLFFKHMTSTLWLPDLETTNQRPNTTHREEYNARKESGNTWEYKQFFFWDPIWWCLNGGPWRVPTWPTKCTGFSSFSPLCAGRFQKVPGKNHWSLHWIADLSNEVADKDGSNHVGPVAHHLMILLTHHFFFMGSTTWISSWDYRASTCLMMLY